MKKITPSTVIASIALFVALSGAGVAAHTAFAPPNSVNTNSIVNGSIRLVDIAPATVRMLKGQSGEVGPAGQTGPAGPQGAPGTFDFSKLTFVQGPDTFVGYMQVGTSQAVCPAGSMVISGGFASSGTLTTISAPTTANGSQVWQASGGNTLNPSGVTLRSVALCLSR
jgi:hypothetical protein